MISIKGGTQTWSKADQTSSLKPDTKQTLSAKEKEEFLGTNDNIGEVLNKIADPNWVDPVKTRRVGNSELGKDAFLKLLLAQMKNQDPTSPMESHEMSAQLAQFSSLEKLQNIDQSLNTMANVNSDSQGSKYDALNLIGKAVGGDSSNVIRQDPNEEHDINFNLVKDASKVTVTIKDAQGQVVREIDLKELKAGPNKVTWNGVNGEGASMGKGEYQVELQAVDSAGRKLAAETKFAGIITGVNFTSEGPVLMMGKQKIRMKEVRSITTPDQLARVTHNDVNNEIQKASDQVVQNNVGSALLDNVAMSRGMINKMSKETGN